MGTKTECLHSDKDIYLSHTQAFTSPPLIHGAPMSSSVWQALTHNALARLHAARSPAKTGGHSRGDLGSDLSRAPVDSWRAFTLSCVQPLAATMSRAVYTFGEANDSLDLQVLAHCCSCNIPGLRYKRP
ncbi:hypothetical protein ElyMa_001905900 [Elysia marginata]|uniref:Uncharacterized protein n=1 Tax=Elysia marginata TaxID=1093978 RepID=A0AAV4ETC5_9GAST|nr:hypothetical protein ElyMa_001905900 [Elysia marginata]